MHFAGASHACTCPSQSGPLCLFAARSACAPRYQRSRLMGFPGPCPATFQMHPVARHAILGASRAVTHTHGLRPLRGSACPFWRIPPPRDIGRARLPRSEVRAYCFRAFLRSRGCQHVSQRPPSQLVRMDPPAYATRSTAAFFLRRVVSAGKGAAPLRSRPSISGAVDSGVIIAASTRSSQMWGSAHPPELLGKWST